MNKRRIVLAILASCLIMVMFSSCETDSNKELVQNQSSKESSSVSSDASDSIVDDLNGNDEQDDTVAQKSSKEYLDLLESYLSKCGNRDEKSTFLECLTHMYRVVEVGSGGEGFMVQVSSKLDGESGKEVLYNISGSDNTKVFLNGETASLTEIKPGCIMSFYGSEIYVSEREVSVGEESRQDPVDVSGVTFLNCWSA